MQLERSHWADSGLELGAAPGSGFGEGAKERDGGRGVRVLDADQHNL